MIDEVSKFLRAFATAFGDTPAVDALIAGLSPAAHDELARMQVVRPREVHA